MRKQIQEAKPKEQDIDALLQDNERFEKDYTVFTFKLNGVPIRFVALTDAEKAIKTERKRIVEKFCFKEPVPTHVNNRKIDNKNPFLQFIKGRQSIRDEIKKYLNQS